MLNILVPSKTMDFAAPHPSYVPSQQPSFLSQAAVIAKELQRFQSQELARLMRISPAIAANVHTMYRHWSTEGNKAALWAYKGDAYKGLKADSLSEASAQWAEKHFLIMSGLYGILRPFDAIAAYRLEMKTPLAVNGTKDLYALWGDTLARFVTSHGHQVICLLASEEYARPVIRYVPSTIPIVTPRFLTQSTNPEQLIAEPQL